MLCCVCLVSVISKCLVWLFSEVSCKNMWEVRKQCFHFIYCGMPGCDEVIYKLWQGSLFFSLPIYNVCFLFLDNEYLFLDLEQKLSKYFGKIWNRESLKVSYFLDIYLDVSNEETE